MLIDKKKSRQYGKDTFHCNSGRGRLSTLPADTGADGSRQRYVPAFLCQ